MRIGIIATDHGEHSAEKLAAACTDQLFKLNVATMDGDKVIEARRMELKVIEALVSHITDAQEETKGALLTDAAAHFARSDLRDPGPRLQAAIDAVLEATKGSSWEEEFKSEASQAHMQAMIGQFLVDTQHLERLYHSDRNPNDLLAKAYKEGPSGVLILGMRPPA